MRLLPQLARHPAHGEVGALAPQRIIIRHHAPQALIVNRQQSQPPLLAQFSGQADAVLRISYAAREVKIDGRVEKIRALLKKRPLLRKEDLKPLVHRVLRLIALQLPEVRIHREVQHQAVVQNHLSVQTGIATQMIGQKRRTVGIALVQHAKSAGNAVGIELDVPAGADVGQSFERAFLIQPALNAAGNSRIKTVVVIVRNHPLQNDPPSLLP